MEIEIHTQLKLKKIKVKTATKGSYCVRITCESHNGLKRSFELVTTTMSELLTSFRIGDVVNIVSEQGVIRRMSRGINVIC